MPDGSSSLASVLGQDRLHGRLALLNRTRLLPSLPEEVLPPDATLLADEHVFLEQARAAIAAEAACAPTGPQAFAAWFERLRDTGPGQNHKLFAWLAEAAPRDAMTWFLSQEIAGEAGFDDLTALVQLRMPQRAKLEMARNYWDEMGRGQARGMHGPMLDVLACALGVAHTPENTLWQSLALANTMTGLAYHRHYAFHAVGALGAIELTAPGRATLVAAGLKRLGVSARDRHYFDLHAVLDVRHAQAWIAEVIVPLVEEDPRRAQAIAEGALMRLACGAACFRAYSRVLVGNR